ncbi:MAG: hypothetical protein WKF36_10940 [Candidatus Nitrosocosmicus sp.]
MINTPNIPQTTLAQQQNSINANTATDTTNTNASSENQIDSFRAEGQISSLASDAIAGRANSNISDIWVVGGDWGFNVVNGNLTNLVTDITMTKIDGTAPHSHSIEKLNNVSGMRIAEGMDNASNMMMSHENEKVALEGNNTMFIGNADITTNGNIEWEDVPIHMAMANGNIITINMNPSKTEDHFLGFPVFGTVQSIIDENGRELTKPQQQQQQ